MAQRLSPLDAAAPDDGAWTTLLTLRTLGPRLALRGRPAAYRMDGTGALERVSHQDAEADLTWRPEGAWRLGHGLPRAQADLLDLYLPLCGGGRLVVGHLGQSLDGRIATAAGDSRYVNGEEDLLHLHRMRALCDAVVVGAATVAADDPRLTTRLVPGPNPVRVVIDPGRRLGGGYGLFQDGAAPTLVACSEAAASAECGPQTIPVPAAGHGLDLASLLEALARRGLKTVFVEGGGVTVSAFLEAGLLDRLQVAVAPLVIGGGRPGLSLPPSTALAHCLRPRARTFQMGPDVLFDCDLRAPAPARTSASGAPRRMG